jgi:hypothetical protein
MPEIMQPRRALVGDVDAHATTGAGDEPNLLVTHACVLPSG